MAEHVYPESIPLMGDRIVFGPSRETKDYLSKEIIDEYQGTISELIEAAKFLSTTEDEFSAKNTLLNLAFIYAKANIEAVAKSIVKTYADDACIYSLEFLYPLYRDRLFNAIDANWEKSDQEKLFNLSWDSEKSAVVVSLDFSMLGTIEEWGQAIITTREERAQKIGDKRRKGKQKRTKSKRWRTHFWEEKYFGAATGTYSDKRPEYYQQRYRETVLRRLDLIPEDHAPWWYILEYGNAGIAAIPNPEPKIKGTHFIDKAGKAIQALARKLFADGYKRAEEELKRLIRTDWGIDIGDISDADEAIAKKLENIVVKFSSEELKPVIANINTRKAFYTKIIDVDRQIKMFISVKGKPFARVWVIDESGMKKELSKKAWKGTP